MIPSSSNTSRHLLRAVAVRWPRAASSTPDLCTAPRKRRTRTRPRRSCGAYGQVLVGPRSSSDVRLFFCLPPGKPGVLFGPRAPLRTVRAGWEVGARRRAGSRRSVSGRLLPNPACTFRYAPGSPLRVCAKCGGVSHPSLNCLTRTVAIAKGKTPSWCHRSARPFGSFEPYVRAKRFIATP